MLGWFLFPIKVQSVRARNAMRRWFLYITIRPPLDVCVDSDTVYAQGYVL